MFDWSCTQMIAAVYGAFISCRWVQAYKPGEWNPSRSWQQSKLKQCLWHLCYVIISNDGHRSRLGIPDMITWYNMVFETWFPRELVPYPFFSCTYNQTFEILTTSVKLFRDVLSRDHWRNNARCILTVTTDKKYIFLKNNKLTGVSKYLRSRVCRHEFVLLWQCIVWFVLKEVFLSWQNVGLLIRSISLGN